MEREALRRLIRDKLEDGRLPYNSIPRVWGGPGNGEACDGCDAVIPKTEFVIEGISLDGGGLLLRPDDLRRPLQLHVKCFQLWDAERRRRRGPASA
jgi:hypothetical protein